MISLAQNMWSWTSVHFPLRHLAKEHSQLARKVTFFVKKRRELLHYSIAGCSFLREHFARFCRTAEVNVTSKLAKLAKIKSRHHFLLGRGERLYRSDSHLEQKEISATISAHDRFPLNIRNLSWTFGCKFVMIPGQPRLPLYFNNFHCMIPTNSGARFSKVP